MPVRFQNASAAALAAGVNIFGQTFPRGALRPDARLRAAIGGAEVAAQFNAKTLHDDGSILLAVVGLARPALAASAEVSCDLAAATGAPAAPIDLVKAMEGHSLVIHRGSATLDVLAALREGLAAGRGDYWLQGPLATQARLVALGEGSQRLVVDVTAYADGGLDAEVQFANDRAMEAGGGRVAQTVRVLLDGTLVEEISVDQGQYQNWHRFYSTNPANGPQRFRGPLNVRHDVETAKAVGAVPVFDVKRGVDEAKLAARGKEADSEAWRAPLATRGVTTYMPAGGGRGDIGVVSLGNASWLISQDHRAAQYALGQAETAAVIPWHHWHAAKATWLNTDSYPKLWTDSRGGIGKADNPASTGLTQHGDGKTGWTLDIAHMPELSLVPYLLTGRRFHLDTLNAQAAFSVLGTWFAKRGASGLLVLDDQQVRHAAWALRGIDNAAYANPDGTPEKAYFQRASAANWKWLVDAIPRLTVSQGEACGRVEGQYGYTKVTPPWQQDYFASTTISAAGRGNPLARAFLRWSTNFLVGRFLAEALGWNPRDGVAYLIPTHGLTNNPKDSPNIATWREMGAKCVTNGESNLAGWSKSQGDYAALGRMTLCGVIAHGSDADASRAREAFGKLMAMAPPFTSDLDFRRDPLWSMEPVRYGATPDIKVVVPTPIVVPEPVVVKPPPAPAVLPPILVGVTEMESLALANFTIERHAMPSSGAWLATRGTGLASGRFDGEAGNYALTVSYLDEPDGVSPMLLSVNGRTLLAWKADQDDDAIRTQTINAVLQKGDVIAVGGTSHLGEYVRLDTLTIAPVRPPLEPGETPVPTPVPQPQPEPQPEPDPRPTPEDPKPQPQPEPIVDPGPQPGPVPDPQPQPEEQPKPPPVVEPQPQPKPDPQPEPEPEADVTLRAEVRAALNGQQPDADKADAIIAAFARYLTATLLRSLDEIRR